jgi:tripartite-type tricarboxylate transporter receptor subunit TctC
MRRRILIGGAATMAALLLPGASRAQGLSNRTVRIVLAQTPGTTPDLIARTLAPRLQARWNQPFIVENRAGAAGAIGMEVLAKSPPDGHTININVSSTVTIPLFFKVPFDVLTSFTPITMVASNIFALVSHSSVPATNVQEFLRWAKTRGNEANYGSPGNGTYHHLFMEQFKLLTGIEMTHIPYKGSAQAFTDLLGGQLSAMFLPMGVALNMSRDGRVRILGGSGRERSSLTPDIPSLHELGVTGFHGEMWLAAWGPADMPTAIVNRYNAELRSILAETDVRDSFAKQGLTVRTSTPEELDRAQRTEYEALAKLVRAANIKAD